MNYLDTVNKILEGIFKQGLLYKSGELAQATNNMAMPPQQMMRDPKVNDLMLNMAMMGSVNGPEANPRETITSVLGRLQAKGTPDQVTKPIDTIIGASREQRLTPEMVKKILQKSTQYKPRVQDVRSGAEDLYNLADKVAQY